MPNANLFGLEIMPAMIEKIDFGPTVFLGNILDKGSLPNKKFDIVTMLGVHSIFDDLESVFDNVSALLKDDGIFYLFGIFNPEEFDVMIKASASSETGFSERKWESGWNCFSKRTVESLLKKKEFDCEFIPFNLGMKIEKNKNDVLRSWTEGDVNGFYIVKNGLQLIHNFYFCRIHKHQ